MSNWTTIPIGNICELINGRAFEPWEWGSSGLPIVRIQNLNDPDKPFNFFEGKYNEKHFIDSGAILLSWSGTPGTSFGCFRWARGPAILNQHIFRVLVDQEIVDGDFFIYAINSKLEEMIRQAHGAVGLRHITKGKLQAIHIPVPRLPEQRRIVARIKECIERVEEIERLRAEALVEAERLASSLYGSLDGGEGWPCRTVGDVITSSRNGRSIPQNGEKANGYVLSISAVHDVSLDFHKIKPVLLPHGIENHYQISLGDVFVSRSNTRELVGLASVAAEGPPSRIIYPDLLIKLEVRRDLVVPRFLAYALRTTESRRQIKDRAVGTSQSMVKISGQRLKEVKIAVPPLEVQAQIIEGFDKLHNFSADLTGTLRSLNSGTLKRAILRKAFTGEL